MWVSKPNLHGSIKWSMVVQAPYIVFFNPGKDFCVTDITSAGLKPRQLGTLIVFIYQFSCHCSGAQHTFDICYVSVDQFQDRVRKGDQVPL